MTPGAGGLFGREMVAEPKPPEKPASRAAALKALANMCPPAAAPNCFGRKTVPCGRSNTRGGDGARQTSFSPEISSSDAALGLLERSQPPPLQPRRELRER